MAAEKNLQEQKAQEAAQAERNLKAQDFAQEAQKKQGSQEAPGEKNPTNWDLRRARKKAQREQDLLEAQREQDAQAAHHTTNSKELVAGRATQSPKQQIASEKGKAPASPPLLPLRQKNSRTALQEQRSGGPHPISQATHQATGL